MPDVAYCTRELAARGIAADTAERPDGSIELRMPAGSTPEQVAAGQAALASIVSEAPLKAAKTAKMVLLDRWYDQTTALGVEVGGATFDSTIEAQNRMDALTTMINAAKSYGYGDDTTPFTVYARGGVAITLPAAALIGLMLQYGQTVAYLSGVYAAAQSALNAATTVEEVDAVVLPGPVAGASPWPSTPSALPFLSAVAKPG